MRRRFKDKGGTLTDRAVTTGLLYNYLEYVTPKDVDGIKRAQVKVSDNDVQATPLSKESASTAQMYGLKPTIIADEVEPMAMIPKISPQDNLFPQYERFGNELLRSALRKIVDEV